MDIGKIIPQFFYDLISRVLPGTVALLGVCWAVGKSVGELAMLPFKGSSALEESTIVLTITLLAASYLAGQLLSPVSDVYQKHVLQRIFTAKFNVLEKAISPQGDYSEAVKQTLIRNLPKGEGEDGAGRTKEQLGSALFVFYDWVRINQPDAGARVAKIRAEYRLYGAVAVIQPLVFVLHALKTQFAAPSVNLNGPVSLALLFVFMLASWSLVRTYWVFQRSVINNYYTIRSKDGSVS